MFEPIAIIGRSCLLPGANSPEALWQNVLTKKYSLKKLTEVEFRLNQAEIYSHLQQQTIWSDVGGTISNFATIFDAHGFNVTAEKILQQDIICQWLLHTGREALLEAGYELSKLKKHQVGAIIGSLNYPSNSFSQYVETTWLLKQPREIIKEESYQHLAQAQPIPESRFMSGYPMMLMAQGLGLTAPTYALDASCASSLYAIKYACDQLHLRRADLMLAGGINATDNLFLHMGFSVFKALSKSGLSRPLHQQADGLLPAHGAVIVALRRLSDAIVDGNNILGVIRGIGLANDGKSKGLFVPDSRSQIIAMQAAYQQADLSPQHISWLETHATGTPLGDETEIKSMHSLFGEHPGLAIGTIKANIGHTITASGAAALINTLSAFKHKLKPPAYPASESPLDVLATTPFQLLQQPTEWSTSKTNPARIAGINSFGFGGNNAHLIVEDWQEHKRKINIKPTKQNHAEIAVVGIGTHVATATNVEEFSAALFQGKSLLSEYMPGQLGGYTPTIELDIVKSRFSPSDLADTLSQQLGIMKSTQEALTHVKNINPESVSVFIGTQCSPEIGQAIVSWRLKQWLPNHNANWLEAARKASLIPMTPAYAVGAMPNIVANRLNQLFNFQASSFAIYDDETSGITALQLGIDALRNNEANTVVVGAIDMCCDYVHQSAMAKYITDTKQPPGDAAITLILKRLVDAKKDQDVIYATIDTVADQSTSIKLNANDSNINQRFGYSFAATSLVHVAASVLACHRQLLPNGNQHTVVPWIGPLQTRNIDVEVTSHNIKINRIRVQAIAGKIPTASQPTLPTIWCYSASNRDDLIKALETNQLALTGSVRLAIALSPDQDLAVQRQAAIEALHANAPLPKNMTYADKPIGGEIAFVFTGSTTSYAHMASDLMYHFPSLVSASVDRIANLDDILSLLNDQANKKSISMINELKTYSFYSQLHAEFAQNILGLKPQACIGYCSGESNALIAMRAWRNIDKLYADTNNSGIYNDTLAGDYSVLNQTWSGPDKWSGWRLHIDVEHVKALIKEETLVRLTIINSPQDCIIAGSPSACINFIKKIKPIHYSRIENSMVIHCNEFAPVTDIWHKLHYRKTYSVPNVRFYSSALATAYQANATDAAVALTNQATKMVDFPRVIHQAWADGVRVFIEMGPRDLCTKWIRDNLQGKEHIAVAMDSSQRKSTIQIAITIANLLAHGIEVNNLAYSINGQINAN